LKYLADIDTGNCSQRALLYVIITKKIINLYHSDDDYNDYNGYTFICVHSAIFYIFK